MSVGFQGDTIIGFCLPPNFLSFPILSYVYFFIRGEHTFVFWFFWWRDLFGFWEKNIFLSFPFKQKKSDQVSLLKKPFQKPKNRIILFCSIHILFYYITTTQDILINEILFYRRLFHNITTNLLLQIYYYNFTILRLFYFRW